MPLHAPETARVAPTPVTQKTNRCFSSMGVRISERPLSVLLCLFIDLKKKKAWVTIRRFLCNPTKTLIKNACKLINTE
jgi:hypothetical protein